MPKNVSNIYVLRNLFKTDHRTFATYITKICFILLFTCFNTFWMKVFLACKQSVVSYFLFKWRLISLVILISPSKSSLHFLWSSSFVFGNFHIPTPLVLLLVPQPNTEQLSPGRKILDQSTANKI